MPIVSHRALAVGAVAALAVAFMLHERGPGRSSGSAESDPPIMQRPSEDPEHPAPPAPMRGLPPLAQSDAAIREALRRMGAMEALMPLLAPEGLVRRFVLTVHHAMGPALPSRLYPLAMAEGAAKIRAQPWEHAVLAYGDFMRYEPYVRAFETLDAKRWVALYVRFYPLLQQAYADLGGGSAYFNDVLVQAIDDLLAAPMPAAPIPVVREGAVYRFEDPRLEARSGGQKALMRIGPENAARVKARLREIRKLLGLRGPPAPR